MEKEKLLKAAHLAETLSSQTSLFDMLERGDMSARLCVWGDVDNCINHRGWKVYNGNGSDNAQVDDLNEELTRHAQEWLRERIALTETKIERL